MASEFDKLRNVFEELGVGGDAVHRSPVGIPTDSVGYLVCKDAGMPVDAMARVASYVALADVIFYFDAEGRYLGYVGGDEQPSWEGRQS